MKLKRSWWWLTLPIVTMFIVFYVDHHSVPDYPPSTWWGAPLRLTLIAVWVYSMIVTIVKCPTSGEIEE